MANTTTNAAKLPQAHPLTTARTFEYSFSISDSPEIEINPVAESLNNKSFLPSNEPNNRKRSGRSVYCTLVEINAFLISSISASLFE